MMAGTLRPALHRHTGDTLGSTREYHCIRQTNCGVPLSQAWLCGRSWIFGSKKESDSYVSKFNPKSGQMDRSNQTDELGQEGGVSYVEPGMVDWGNKIRRRSKSLCNPGNVGGLLATHVPPF